MKEKIWQLRMSYTRFDYIFSVALSNFLRFRLQLSSSSKLGDFVRRTMYPRWQQNKNARNERQIMFRGSRDSSSWLAHDTIWRVKLALIVCWKEIWWQGQQMNELSLYFSVLNLRALFKGSSDSNLVGLRGRPSINSNWSFDNFMRGKFTSA